MTFHGELMTCVICGAQQDSDPAVESDWRYIEVGMKAGYVCPDHFPADGARASKGDWSKAYQVAFIAVLEHGADRDVGGGMRVDVFKE